MDTKQVIVVLGWLDFCLHLYVYCFYQRQQGTSVTVGNRPIVSWCLWCQIWGSVHTYMWSMTSIQQQCFNGSHQVEMRHDRSTRGWWGNSVTSFGQIDHKGKSFVIGLWALRKKKLIWDWKMTFNIVYYSKPHKKIIY